jgi:hypothetical protein
MNQLQTAICVFALSDSTSTIYSARAPSHVDHDELWFCGWLLRIATTVKVTSMRMYTAAVQYSQVNEGFQWELAGSEMLRRTLRFLKRKYPTKEKALKVPVCFGFLKKTLLLLPAAAGRCWKPGLENMSHEDRVFAAASVIAVSAFLRGGEFLMMITYPRSDRQVLEHQGIVKRKVANDPALLVKVPAPKMNEDVVRIRVTVPIFVPPTLQGVPADAFAQFAYMPGPI